MFHTLAEMAMEMDEPMDDHRFSTATAMPMSWCGTEACTATYDDVMEMAPPMPMRTCDETSTPSVGCLVA